MSRCGGSDAEDQEDEGEGSEVNNLRREDLRRGGGGWSG